MSEKKLNIIQLLLIWCCGADQDLLTTCARTVVMKYVWLGLLILIPSMFAFISASYLLSTVFIHGEQATWIAMGGGLFWGLVIFSLDRFLVMTFTKTNSPLRDFFSVSMLSRMTLAILVGFVVAHPLVLKMFEPNLNQLLHDRHEGHSKLIAVEYDAKITQADSELTALADKLAGLKSAGATLKPCNEDPELQRQISDKETQINVANQEYADEVAGNANSRTQRGGEGPVARTIAARITTLQNQLNDLSTRLHSARSTCETNQLAAMREAAENDKTLLATQLKQLSEQHTAKQQALAQLNAEREQKLAEFKHYAAYDFLTKSNALEELAQQNPNVRFWEILMTLVMWVVDLSAILMKLTCTLDEYDKKKYTEAAQRLGELDRQAQALLEAEPLHLENALQQQYCQIKHTKARQQASSTLEHLQAVNLMLCQLADTQNQFNDAMLLNVMAKRVDPNDPNIMKMLADYKHLVARAHSQLLTADAWS